MTSGISPVTVSNSFSPVMESSLWKDFRATNRSSLKMKCERFEVIYNISRMKIKCGMMIEYNIDVQIKSCMYNLCKQ